MSVKGPGVRPGPGGRPRRRAVTGTRNRACDFPRPQAPGPANPITSLNLNSGAKTVCWLMTRTADTVTRWPPGRGTGSDWQRRGRGGGRCTRLRLGHCDPGAAAATCKSERLPFRATAGPALAPGPPAPPGPTVPGCQPGPWQCHRDVERPVTVTGAPSQGWRSQAASESDWNSPEPSW
jgi:hypothetical protein